MFQHFLEKPLQSKMVMKAHICLVVNTTTPLKNYFYKSFKTQYGFRIKKVMIKEMLVGVA
jgi:hypothetical protein